MSYLFEIRGQSVLPDPSILLVSPFKEIWDRDTSKDKSIALKELAYCEFMASPMRSNPFSGYPEKNRSEVIISSLFKGKKWKPDATIHQAVDFIREIQSDGSLTYSYYMAARKSAEGMKEFFQNVDLTERNDKGMPVYKPKEITSALIDTSKVLENLDSLQKKVEEDLYDTVKVKSGKTISPFADPSSLNKI